MDDAGCIHSPKFHEEGRVQWCLMLAHISVSRTGRGQPVLLKHPDDFVAARRVKGVNGSVDNGIGSLSVKYPPDQILIPLPIFQRDELINSF